jgi:DNA/RNA endonuclease YhcR with UshA esterase domain
MMRHSEINDACLRNKIRQKEIGLGGNSNLKIYGKLSCTSGKRMKRENRVFFSSEKDAIEQDYRPCGGCLKEKYKVWKNGFIQ